MAGKQFRCPECGRFANKQYVRKNGFCEVCDSEAVSEIMGEEAELDPTGPCAAALSGDYSQLRRGYQ